MGRAHGADISHWKREIDWEILASKVDFVFMKSTEGVWVDERFLENNAASEGYPIHRAPYHYFRVSVDLEDQAGVFGAAYNRSEWSLPPVVDIEKRNNWELMSKREFGVKALRFLLLVEEETGIKPIIYSSYYALFDLMGEQEWLYNYDLWIARYYFTVNPEEQWPMTPEGGDPDKLWFWQYTERGPGHEYGVESNRIDLNKFREDRQALDVYAASYGGKPVEPPEFHPFVVRINTNGLNVRATPNTSIDPLGVVYRGSTWEVYEISGNWGKISPYQGWIHLGYTEPA